MTVTDVSQRRISTPRRVFMLLVLVAVVTPSAGLWWASDVAHAAVARRAIAGNQATASALGAAVGRSYISRQTTATNLALLMENGLALQALSLGVRSGVSSPYCRLTMLSSSGQTLRSLGIGRCAKQSPALPTTRTSSGTAVTVPSSVVDGVGVGGVLVRLDKPIGAGQPLTGQAAWLFFQYRVSDLVDPVHVGRTGTYTVVDRATQIVLDGPDGSLIGSRVASPEGLALISGDRPAAVQTYAARLHSQVLTAYQPVADTPYGVFVTLPSAEAFADADHLTRELTAGAVVLALLGVSVAVWVARLLARRDRQLSEQMEVLRELASTDRLTGLANRGSILDHLDRQLLRLRAGAADGLAVLFVDLDGVKQLNDAYGHGATDQLLVAIASSLQAVMRPSDAIARIGGDEFVAVATGVRSELEAELLAGRLRVAVASTSTPLGTSALRLGPLTASIGVTLLAPDDATTTGAELLHRADEAMYHAKRKGGDSVHLVSNESDQEPAL